MIDVALLTVISTTSIGIGGLLTTWLNSRRTNKKDYTDVALQGMAQILDEMRTEMARRDKAAAERETAFTREIARLRAEVRTLRSIIEANGIAIPDPLH